MKNVPLFLSLALLALLGCAAEGLSARRFGEYRVRLGGITDRALSFALADLCASAMVERSVRNAAPPQPMYAPTSRSGPIGRLLGSMRVNPS